MQTLKLHIIALGGVPLALYLLWHQEWLGAAVFGSMGVGCLSAVLDKHLAQPPKHLSTVALVSFGLALVFLAVLVIRSMGASQ